MILNRRALKKPLTAKATSTFAQKRAQSGNPGAPRMNATGGAGGHNNRLYQRNMTNAQSYNYERGGIIASGMGVGTDQMLGHIPPRQQTLLLSNATTSYPTFSDVDVNSLGMVVRNAGVSSGGNMVLTGT